MKPLLTAIAVVLAIFTVLGMSWHRGAVNQSASAPFSSQEPTPMPSPTPTPSPSPSPSGTATPYPEPTPTITPLKNLAN